MTTPNMDDEQELLRLVKLMFDSAHQGGVPTLKHYLDDDFLLTYSLYEQDKRGFMNKEQIIAKWGSQHEDDGTTTVISEQRVLLSGDTAIFFALVTDKFSDQTQQDVRTWISDVWVKRNGEWRWLASHESFLK